jgi:hypothetical protein
VTLLRRRPHDPGGRRRVRRKELAKQPARATSTRRRSRRRHHAHYDHAVNFTLFPNATVWIGAAELEWASRQPPGFNPLPELYVRELASSDRVRLAAYVVPAGPEGARCPVPGTALPDRWPGADMFTGDAAKNRAISPGGSIIGGFPGERGARCVRSGRSARVPGTLLIPATT